MSPRSLLLSGALLSAGCFVGPPVHERVYGPPVASYDYYDPPSATVFVERPRYYVVERDRYRTYREPSRSRTRRYSRPDDPMYHRRDRDRDRDHDHHDD